MLPETAHGVHGGAVTPTEPYTPTRTRETRYVRAWGAALSADHRIRLSVTSIGYEVIQCSPARCFVSLHDTTR